MTVVGLAAAATPVNAAPEPENEIGIAWTSRGLSGGGYRLESQVNCRPLPRLGFSAENRSTSSTIKLYKYANFGCSEELAVLGPGEIDNGYVNNTFEFTELGTWGAVA